MFPAAFNGETRYLSSPEGVSSKEVGALSIADIKVGPAEVPAVLSCWRLTRSELEEVNRTGRVWLAVLGHTMPPVWLVAHNPLESYDDGNSEQQDDDP